MGILSKWNKLTLNLVHFVEKCFFKLGVLVATHPWRTIILCWLFVAVSSLGLLNFYHEKHPFNLWVPPNSDFAKDTKWLMEKFSSGFRLQYVLATADNVLTPPVLTELSKINEEINKINAELNNEKFTWTDICFRVPIVPSYVHNGNKKRSITNSTKDDSPFSGDFFSDNENYNAEMEQNFGILAKSFYCSIFENLETGCYQRSLLDLWKYNTTLIGNLTQEEIIHKINTVKISPVLGHHMNYVSTLGGVQRDANDNIAGAASVLLAWILYVNFTDIDPTKTGNDAGTEAWASEATLAWEEKFLQVMGNVSHNVSGLDIFYEAGRSFGDVSGSTMFQDIDKLSVGIAMMFIYIQLILSKFSWVDIRLTLGSIGLLCIGMALIVAVSLCSLFGIPYGPVHSSLPFLIMGLGIDDMFVMKACWEQLDETQRKLPLPSRIGLMLQHAGVSIVITSFTDIVAFLIGAITILPSLQAFCFYAAVGVLFVFVFSCTFYVAIFVLDLRRMDQKRNGILFCIKHPDYVSFNQDHKSVSQLIIRFVYSKVIFTLPCKIIVIAFTVIMAGFSLESLLKLEQRFEPIWFIPENTYYRQFLSKRELYYPEIGNEGTVYVGAVNYSQEIPKILSLVDKMRFNSNVIDHIDSWTDPFRDYVLSNHEKDILHTTLLPNEWDIYLSDFLFSSAGASYMFKFRFTDIIKCGQPAPPILVSSIDFRFKNFPGPDVYLPAMHWVKDTVQETNLTTGDGYIMAWSKVFSNWVTDEIIYVEVERNLELALACVMGCTIILITDLQVCFWIFMCVLLTLVNVCGWMQRWGLTVDIVSCVGLELAIGLCVDYAAHIGHTFLTLEGTRNERAFKTVTSIGAAVLYGGGSTFLSLSVLSFSQSYIFKSFFKIFLLVILFGLFHGIVFFPVILSLIGPKPFKPAKVLSNTAHNSNDVEIASLQNPEQIIKLTDHSVKDIDS